MIFRTGVKPRSLKLVGVANVWFCDGCGAHGSAEFTDQDTIGGALEQISRAHRMESPKCTAGTKQIRIVSLEQLRGKGLLV